MVSKKSQYEKLRKEAAMTLGGKCAVCEKRFGKNFQFHHLRYITGEPTYRNFKLGIDYNLYILPKIIAEPDRFVLLCRNHHHAVEQLKRFKRDKLHRLINIVLSSE